MEGNRRHKSEEPFLSRSGVTSGVPQGSVFGSLLFLIHVKDLQEGLDLYMNMFADDVKVMGGVIMREARDDVDCIHIQKGLIQASKLV